MSWLNWQKEKSRTFSVTYAVWVQRKLFAKKKNVIESWKEIQRKFHMFVLFKIDFLLFYEAVFFNNLLAMFQLFCFFL